jgi:5'-deoxynucleotidase YfbR-like HD superfamily hydrolase
MQFNKFIRALEFYTLKRIPRNSTNEYFDEKDKIAYRRRETTAEHVYSTLRLADYFLTAEREFTGLDRLCVYELLMYHDDVEAITGDTGISERGKRQSKDLDEIMNIPILAKRYPSPLDEKLIRLDSAYRNGSTAEAWFARAIDKMDALVHELQYPEDWGPKGFDEQNVRNWFQPAFAYSQAFSGHFEYLIGYLKENGYFEVNQNEKSSEMSQ